jgi:membrane protease YdiL (CAAX protease family)
MLSPLDRHDNDLFRQARRGERLTPIWLVIPLAFLIPLISSLGSFPLLIFNAASRMSEILALLENDPVSEIDQNAMLVMMLPKTALGYGLFLILSFLGIYLLLWGWVRFFEKRPFSSLGFEGSDGWLKFGRGFLVGAFLFAIPVLGMVLLGYYTSDPNYTFNLNIVGTICLVLLGWLIQGPAEELLFRGWVLPVTAARYRPLIGIGVSALLFSLLHLSNPNVSVIAVLNLFLFGLFAALYSLAEEGIWGICGLHAVWNWVQGNIFGLEVSGLRPPGGSLLILEERGPDLITGGAFGPEGGLMITLALTVASSFLIWLSRRRTGPL